MAPNNIHSGSPTKHVCKLHTSYRTTNCTSNSNNTLLIYIIR